MNKELKTCSYCKKDYHYHYTKKITPNKVICVDCSRLQIEAVSA